MGILHRHHLDLSTPEAVHEEVWPRRAAFPVSSGSGRPFIDWLHGFYRRNGRGQMIGNATLFRWRGDRRHRYSSITSSLVIRDVFHTVAVAGGRRQRKFSTSLASRDPVGSLSRAARASSAAPARSPAEPSAQLLLEGQSETHEDAFASAEGSPIISRAAARLNLAFEEEGSSA